MSYVYLVQGLSCLVIVCLGSVMVPYTETKLFLLVFQSNMQQSAKNTLIYQLRSYDRLSFLFNNHLGTKLVLRCLISRPILIIKVPKFAQTRTETRPEFSLRLIRLQVIILGQVKFQAIGFGTRACSVHVQSVFSKWQPCYHQQCSTSGQGGLQVSVNC